jgi:hypothetical protein
MNLLLRALAPCLLLGCQAFELRSFDDISAVRVYPPFTKVAPVEPGTYGRFPVTLKGRDTLRGMQWLPGFGSSLLVRTDEIGEYAVDPDADHVVEPSFYISYTLYQEIGTLEDSATWPDDGVLRFFFTFQDPIDVWVEVDNDLAPPDDTDPDAPTEEAP